MLGYGGPRADVQDGCFAQFSCEEIEADRHEFPQVIQPIGQARILNCLSDSTAVLVPLHGTHHGSLPALDTLPSYATCRRPFRGQRAASWRWAGEELKCKLASGQHAGFRDLVAWMASHPAGETGTEFPEAAEQHGSRTPQILIFLYPHLKNCLNAIIPGIKNICRSVGFGQNFEIHPKQERNN